MPNRPPITLKQAQKATLALKQYIAKGIQDSMLKSLGSELERSAPAVFDVETAEVLIISNLETQIRVKTRSTGAHYYTVKITEHL